jgi:aspartate kinase
MNLMVWKLGGSVLVDLSTYRDCARLIRDRLRSEPHSRIVAVVSARAGETDELMALATSLVDDPEGPILDLLWSTGEIRSTAILTFCLQAVGVRVTALDVHQAGISCSESLHVDPSPIRCALVSHEVVVVPGFLACGAGSAVVTLGRGGSDLSAVAIAAALRADRCELIKDVAGYYTADPHQNADAEHVAVVNYERALAMARRGCGLVQAAALDAARRANLTLVVRAADDSQRTIVTPL